MSNQYLNSKTQAHAVRKTGQKSWTKVNKSPAGPVKTSMPLFPSLSRSQWRTSSTFFTFTARSETLWGMCLATRWGLTYLELEVPIITSQSRALVHPAGWTSWSLLATWSLDDLQKNTLEGISNGVGFGNSCLGWVIEYLVLLPADFVSLLLSLFLLLVLPYKQALFFNQGFPGWG